jgi:hypothetical protein
MISITERLQHCANHFPKIDDNPYSVFVDAKTEIESLQAQIVELKAKTHSFENCIYFATCLRASTDDDDKEDTKT